MRGRRQVGKSTLLTEWLRRSRVPAVFFTASRRAPAREIEFFARDVAESSLPLGGGLLYRPPHPADWDDALSLLASTHDTGVSAVVVVDEFPYLVASDQSVETTFQKLWDRRLRHLPLLLVLVGSDLGMMAALTGYDRPLYGRSSGELVIDPLSPLDVATLLGLGPAEALDAYLVVGGFPGVVTSWPRASAAAFVESALADPRRRRWWSWGSAASPPRSRRTPSARTNGAFRAIGERAGVSDACALASCRRKGRSRWRTRWPPNRAQAAPVPGRRPVPALVAPAHRP